MSVQQTIHCQFFDEDLVVKTTKIGTVEFGLVLESAENADSDTDESSSDEESSNSHKWKRVKPGYAKVAWHDRGRSQVVQEDQVKLYDRSLLPGDIVRRWTSIQLDKQKGEVGFCQDIALSVTIKIVGTNKVINDVDCKNLISLTNNIAVDTVCIYDYWIGYIREINFKLTLKCADGSTLVVYDEDLDEFNDCFVQNGNYSEFAKDDFYVGQKLYGPKRALKNAKWIHQTEEMKVNINSRRHGNIKVAVEEVVIDRVSVNWISCVSLESVFKNKTLKDKLGQDGKDKAVSDDSNQQPDPERLFMPLPSEFICGEDIKRIKCLNYFQKCSLQIGDHCYYKLLAEDKLLDFDEWKQEEFNKMFKNSSKETNDLISSNLNQNDSKESDESQKVPTFEKIRNEASKIKKRRKRLSFPVIRVRNRKLKLAKKKPICILPIKLLPNCCYPVEIVATKTVVTVVWQSGTIESNIASNSLYPVHYIDTHDFFPGDFVVENEDSEDLFKYGVIQKVNYVQRTADIKWLRNSSEPTVSPTLISQEDTSVYEIKDHPDFKFRPGCCVVKISSEDSSKNEMLKAGQVIDLKTNGQLLCFWSDSSISLVYPYELFIIGDYDSDDLWADSDDESFSDEDLSDDQSWETDSNDSKNSEKDSRESSSYKPALKKPKVSLDPLDVIRNSLKQLEELMSQNSYFNYRKGLSFVQDIFRMTRRIKSLSDKLETPGCSQASGNNGLDEVSSKFHQITNKVLKIFSNLGNNSEDASKSVKDEDGDAISDNNDNEVIKSLKMEISCICENVDNTILKNETPIENGCQSSQSDLSQEFDKKDQSKTEDLKNNKGFVQLDSVPDGHHWKNSAHIQPLEPVKFFKRISEEIKLLRTSLPNDIHVACFEDRIDLYSVLIVGPKSTPYDGGLFLFDLQLPDNYPQSPPNVFYLSFCSDRLNPNLYENGKVCVSLLGTWTGKGTEVWSSKTSNLLQVIVSIQGLILVQEPYYNEAGYMKQRGTISGQENSNLYNEMVVIKLVQSMTKLLRHTPETFKEIIHNYLVENSAEFIKRHENYILISEFCNSKFIRTSEELNNCNELPQSYLPLPDFPLLPASQGFCLTLKKAIEEFKQTVNNYKSK